MSLLKYMKLTKIAAWAAHLWAWAVGLWMTFGPFYSDGATLVEQNGAYVLLILLFPILMSGIALLAIRFIDAGRVARKALLWTIALVLVVLCIATYISICIFYLPMVIALLIVAIRNGGLKPARSQ